MAGSLKKTLESALGASISNSRALSGGDIADVSCLQLSDGRKVVAKRPRIDQPDTTSVEKMMLTFLARKSPLPVPKVLFQTKGILVIEHIEHAGTSNPELVTADIAAHVAALHASEPKGGQPYYGFEKETFIGPLPQYNTPSNNWIDFFREHRLLSMAQSCVRTQKIPPETFDQIEKLAAKLADFLPQKPPSSLLHGDLWAGNVLVNGNTVAAFIDPAISYGHHEMDLAFIALMGGQPDVFFDHYRNHRAIEPGYAEERQYIYQLWPLLVHARLFGGGYIRQIETILDRFGL
jgi:fructosamine-3-kinase